MFETAEAHPKRTQKVARTVPQDQGTLRAKALVMFTGLDNQTIFRTVTLHVDYCTQEQTARADVEKLRSLNGGAQIHASYTVQL